MGLSEGCELGPLEEAHLSRVLRGQLHASHGIASEASILHRGTEDRPQDDGMTAYRARGEGSGHDLFGDHRSDVRRGDLRQRPPSESWDEVVPHDAEIERPSRRSQVDC